MSQTGPGTEELEVVKGASASLKILTAYCSRLHFSCKVQLQHKDMLTA